MSASIARMIRCFEKAHNDNAVLGPAHSANSKRIVRTYKRSARASLARLAYRDGEEG